MSHDPETLEDARSTLSKLVRCYVEFRIVSLISESALFLIKFRPNRTVKVHRNLHSPTINFEDPL